MALPSYGTDLQTFDLAEDTGAWLEFTNMAGGGNPAEDDTDNEIQGTYMTSQTANTTGLVSLGKDYGSSITISGGFVFLVWHQLSSPGAMDTYANGGMRLVVGSSSANWKAYAVGGRLTPPNPYGGWQNNPVDPSLDHDYSNGTPPTGSGQAYDVVGCACNLLTAIFKGNPHQCDAIRYGRAEARISGGQSGSYATFTGFSAINDANDAVDGYNRWGLLQSIQGGFLWKGQMTLGYGSAVDFRDANQNIFVQDTRKVQSGFNRIEVRNASSRVDWTSVSFKALGTVSRGQFEAVDDADINIDGCSFTDMDTFIFQPNSSVINSIFEGCNLITSGRGTFTSTKVLTPTVDANTSALLWEYASDPGTYLSGMTFTKGDNAHHAIEFATGTATTINLSNMTFTGFNASNGQNDSVLHFTSVTGSYTVNAAGVVGTLSYKAEGGTVVTINAGVAVTIEANVSLSGAEIRIYDLDVTPPEFGTELAGTESNVGSTYVYTGDAANTIIIQIMLSGYEEYIQEYVIPASTTTLNVILRPDVNA